LPASTGRRSNVYPGPEEYLKTYSLALKTKFNILRGKGSLAKCSARVGE